ncbi:hypothetical protein RVR_3024 [Actinacidiphila reveromycinica]|uniref:Uncharacterized protein n=2 Tax=Actinacidiphila reveromycinica TaxID=659352 RepID=A0A7U3UR85_9ACTN|nr:hypothetical protein RVR_3024 [Streptomyces sp. SN-593]
MVLHMPFVLALAAATFFLSRKAGLKATHAVVCGAFGFSLADTSPATSLHSAGAGMLGMIGGIGP